MVMAHTICETVGKWLFFQGQKRIAQLEFKIPYDHPILTFSSSIEIVH